MSAADFYGQQIVGQREDILELDGFDLPDAPALPQAEDIYDRKATEKQAAFIARLVEERGQAGLDRLRAVLDVTGALDVYGVSRTDASTLIEGLLAMPRAPRTDAKGAALTEGFYGKAGKVYKVVPSQAGYLYAKRLTEEGGWEYDRGAISTLGGADRLTLDQAREYGQLTGRCAICGRLLTNEESIDYGIGPVCRERGGF